MCVKYVERNVPDWLEVKVVHLHEGNSSKRERKRIAKTNAKYVSVAKLVDTARRAIVAEGTAACSQGDNPNRSIGRAIAVGRALKEYDEATCGMLFGSPDTLDIREYI